MQQRISLREANKNLSQYIEMVKQGVEIIITKRGQPIARLLGIPKKRELTTRQKKVWLHLLSNLKKGYHLGGKKFNRDESHK